MKLKRKKKPFFIPVFSMSDIAFLLLIFIMLVSLINYRKEVNIEFPEASSALRTSADQNFEVWIDFNGNIYLDGIPGDRQTLELKIRELNETFPDTRAHVIADRNTPYDRINYVLEAFQINHYRTVSFVVKTDE
ncbi:MAG: biopolymer transporter ExbD [Treponema sp.]|nr:biopolymer transporter ExbD [Treponema sp.]